MTPLWRLLFCLPKLISFVFSLWKSVKECTLLKSEEKVLSDTPKGRPLTKVVRCTDVSVYVYALVSIFKQYTQLDKEEEQLAKLLVRDLFILSLSTRTVVRFNRDP